LTLYRPSYLCEIGAFEVAFDFVAAHFSAPSVERLSLTAV